MAVKIISLRCPECGANLPDENARQVSFCAYCGAKLLIHNENEYIQRNINQTTIIDVARVREADATKAVRLRELELIDKERTSKRKKRRAKVLLAVILIVLGGLSGMAAPMFFGLVLVGIWMLIPSSDGEPDDEFDDDFSEIILTAPMLDCIGKNVRDVDGIFREAGFRNILLMPLNDLTVFVRRKENKVQSIEINGKKHCKVNQVVPRDARVVINYHSRYAG